MAFTLYKGPVLHQRDTYHEQQPNKAELRETSQCATAAQHVQDKYSCFLYENNNRDCHTRLQNKIGQHYMQALHS